MLMKFWLNSDSKADHGLDVSGYLSLGRDTPVYGSGPDILCTVLTRSRFVLRSFIAVLFWESKLCIPFRQYCFCLELAFQGQVHIDASKDTKVGALCLSVNLPEEEGV